jgi:5-methylcytosine-specific restriction endonuclease McrA
MKDKNYRGKDWETQRKKALLRDKHSCRKCGKKTNIVHHIIPYSQSHCNQLWNLESLCLHHHRIQDLKFDTIGITHYVRNTIKQNLNWNTNDMLIDELIWKVRQ